MATPAVVVVVTVALLSLLALGLTVIALLRHLKGLAATLRGVQEQLAPALEQLSEDTAVTQAELARVSEAAERLQEQRER